MAPKVYFTDFCTGTSETLPQKLSRLILSAGIDQIDFKDKFVDAVRFAKGEGIEKKEEDFAAEVAAQMNMGKK